MITSGDVRRAKQKAVGGKKDRCRKGKSCSATCISGWKACLVEMSDAVSESVVKAKEAVRDRLGLKPKDREDSRAKGQSLDGKNLDNGLLARRVDAWRKKLSLKAIDDINNASGHDETHVLLGDYLGRTTKQIARLIGAPGTGPSVIEEAFVNTVETLLGKTPRERKRFLKSQEVRGLLKRHFNFLNQMYPSDENRRLLERSDRVINSFLRVMSRLERRRDFDQFLKTVSVAREHMAERARVAGLLEKRKQKYSSVKGSLYNDMFEAASKGDRRRYQEAEAKLLTLMSKAGKKFGDKDVLEKGSIWDMYSSTLPHKLGQSLLKPGSDIKMDVSGNVVELTSRVRGEKLDLRITPSSFLFKVNDSVISGENLPLATRVALIKETRRQFAEVVRNMREGTVLRVSAASGDSSEMARLKGYTRFGFSAQDREGNMYGKVVNGKVVPITREEFERGQSSEFGESGGSKDHSSVKRFLSLDETAKLKKDGKVREIGLFSLSLGTIGKDNRLRDYGSLLLRGTQV